MKGFNNLINANSYLNKEKFVLSYYASDIKKNYDEYLILEETANEVKNINTTREVKDESKKSSRASLLHIHKEKTFGTISSISNQYNQNISERGKGPISNRISLRTTIAPPTQKQNSDKKLHLSSDGFKRRITRFSTCKYFK